MKNYTQFQALQSTVYLILIKEHFDLTDDINILSKGQLEPLACDANVGYLVDASTGEMLHSQSCFVSKQQPLQEVLCVNLKQVRIFPVSNKR